MSVWVDKAPRSAAQSALPGPASDGPSARIVPRRPERPVLAGDMRPAGSVPASGTEPAASPARARKRRRCGAVASPGCSWPVSGLDTWLLPPGCAAPSIMVPSGSGLARAASPLGAGRQQAGGPWLSSRARPHRPGRARRFLRDVRRVSLCVVDEGGVWYASINVRVQCVLRNMVRPVAIARAARACQTCEVTRAASVLFRMLAHSMNTFGMVDRLVPARSSRGWIPLIPS